jgi:hypothetical protein
MGAGTAQRLSARPAQVSAADLLPGRTQPRPHSLYRDTASFGKRSEFIAMAELLRRGFDVYATLVHDQWIACIVRLESGLPDSPCVRPGPTKQRLATCSRPRTYSGAQR